MSEKLSQERLEEISRKPFTVTSNDVLAMADELVGARYEIQSLRDKLSDARLEARFNDTNE